MLAQVVFLLGLFHLLLDALVDFAFQLQYLALIAQNIQQLLQTLAHVDRLENFLLLLDLQRQVACDHIGETSGLFDIRYRSERLGRYLLDNVI